MYATRVAKPKLSLKITTTATGVPSLSLPSPAAMAMPRTPLSPNPRSPTALNTSRNRKISLAHLSPLQQQPSFNYANSSTTKSILKKSNAANNGLAGTRRIQFSGEPTVHCVTPIENPDEYYGSYMKMSKEERSVHAIDAENEFDEVSFAIGL
ncbi:hypothetical protein PRK78_004296 [Emydomyces testavorans]|uniref:Uncharacterized protein n=1 Tax=Emydomyces testavorans TaxID=2070801 RepID=A0AAF0IJ50_9EURO|nr:hypothetical protein PRK78_004296 [Emydomyces testavorans]